MAMSLVALNNRGPLKHTKETSACIGVSPDTEKFRPPSKKQLSRRQLSFEEGKMTIMHNT